MALSGRERQIGDSCSGAFASLFLPLIFLDKQAQVSFHDFLRVSSTGALVIWFSGYVRHKTSRREHGEKGARKICGINRPET